MQAPAPPQITVDGTTFHLVPALQFEAGLERGDDAVDELHGAVAAMASQAPDIGAPPLATWKTGSMVDELASVIEEVRPRRIFELGIANGGSTALLAALAPEATVVAVEIEPAVRALDDHIERRGLHHRIRPHYSVDQADGQRLRRIVADEFAGEPIDLVIDDASHQLDATRASLDALFPLVRAGGCYLIEDWAWAHMDLSWVGSAAAWLPKGEPMSQLVYELMMVMGSQRDIVRRVDADMMTTRCWRGSASIDPETWSLAAEVHSVAPIRLG
jgi:predicted O-methyltransferase YrrM